MDISSLRERNSDSELTVSELNLYIKRIFDLDRKLNAVTVRGEISNFTSHRTGHLYFSLKDEESQVKAVMFRSAAAKLRFMPENGMKVIVRCSVSVYHPTGAYQLYVTSMEPDGIGALYLAYEQLKQRLEAEGLFSNEFKKPIPELPKRIGVITSPTGAAVRDIINVTSRRYPIAEIFLYPSLVQGDGAEKNLIEAVDYFDKSALVDVIIIGRGGGSIEDLWAFNSEALARRIFECRIPVISAVGHETDFTICDFVSDLRAPTPSAAAEISVPDYRDILLKFGVIYDNAVRALTRRIERAETRLERYKSSSGIKNPNEIFEDKVIKLDNQRAAILRAAEGVLAAKSNAFAIAVKKTNALSPLSVIARGYSVVSGAEKQIIKDISDVKLGDPLQIRVSNGNIIATVNEVRSLDNE